MVKKVLYIGWTRHGNVGDDVLFCIFKNLLISEASKLAIAIDIDEVYEEYDFSLYPYDLVVLGGGSILAIPHYLDICLKANELSIPTIVWGSGIDIRNKSTFQVLEYFNKNLEMIALEDVVKGYSKVKMVVENSKLTGVRGSITKYILKSDEVKVIGDPAIVLGKLNLKLPDLREIENFIGSSEDVVLVNWGTQYNHIIGGNEQQIMDELKNVIKVLLVRNYKVIIYPIWTKDGVTCENFSNSFNSSKVFFINKVYDFYGICSVIKKCKFTINFKLHASIISMSMRKPFISLAYGLKCIDFAQSIDAMNLVITTDNVYASQLLDKIAFVEENYSELQSLFDIKINECYENQIDFIKSILPLLN